MRISNEGILLYGLICFFTTNTLAFHLNDKDVYRDILNKVAGILRQDETLRFDRLRDEEALRYRPVLTDVGYGSRVNTGSELAAKKVVQSSVYGQRGPGRRRRKRQAQFDPFQRT